MRIVAPSWYVQMVANYVWPLVDYRPDEREYYFHRRQCSRIYTQNVALSKLADRNLYWTHRHIYRIAIDEVQKF